MPKLSAKRSAAAWLRDPTATATPESLSRRSLANELAIPPVPRMPHRTGLSTVAASLRRPVSLVSIIHPRGAAAERIAVADGPATLGFGRQIRRHPPLGGDFESAGAERLALGVIEVRGDDDCLDGAAPRGLGQARAQQRRARRRPFLFVAHREVVDLAGQAAGVVDRGRGQQGRDQEPGHLTVFLADQRDDLAVGDQADQVGVVPVDRIGGGPPEHRLGPGVLLAAGGGHAGHRGGVGLGCGAYSIAHLPSRRQGHDRRLSNQRHEWLLATFALVTSVVYQDIPWRQSAHPTVMIMGSPRSPRQERPLAEQHEQWMAHLRRNVVSRRTIVRGAVGAAAGGLLLGAGNWSEQAVAAALTSTGTVAGGFVVNGRHLSFGDDPSREMWVGGQLFNLHKYNAVPPKSVKVWLQYGRDRSYGHTVEAEIRELLTHVPVWDGKPGVLKASRTLNADQFFVHAHVDRLAPGTEYHYRFRYTSGREVGVTPDATFITAPGETREPFTFTAFGDEGIPGPTLDRDPSLLPESDWGEWNNGSFDPGDPDAPSRTKVNTTNPGIRGITKGRNLNNHTPSRFNLQAGDLCYAQAQGDVQPIINPDGPNGSQPSSGNTPQPAANSGGWDYYDPWIWTSWFPQRHDRRRRPQDPG